MPKIRHQTEVKRENLGMLFALVRDGLCASRSELVRRTRLSPSTVSQLTDELLARELLTETDMPHNGEAGPGRKPVGLALNTRTHFLMGVSIEEHQLTADVYDLALRRVGTPFRRPLKPSPLDTDTLLQCLTDIMPNSGGHPVKGVGIALPALVNDNSQDVQIAIWLSMMQTDIKTPLQQRLGIPVKLMNEARASALAEKLLQTADIQDMLYLSFVNHGLGACHIHQRPDGTNRCEAVEAGHLSVAWDGRPCRCGGIGCFEAYCSSKAILSDYKACKQLGEESSVSLADLAEEARRGDACARQCLENTARMMGAGLATLINLYHPQLLVLGGDIRALGAEFLQDVSGQAQSRALAPLAAACRIAYALSPPQPCLGAALGVYDSTVDTIISA